MELCDAIEAGDVARARQLLQAGADPDSCTEAGVPAIVLAARAGAAELVRALLAAGATPGLMCGGELTEEMIFGDVDDLVDAALEEEDAMGAAIRLGHLEVVRVLVEAGEPLGLDEDDPLFTPPLVWAAAHGRPAIAALLLEAGAPLDDGVELSPLATAAEAGQVGVMRLLLDAGADPERGDMDGVTALMLAAAAGRLDAVELLLERGANPDARADGDTALSLAASSGHRAVYERLHAAASPQTRASADASVLAQGEETARRAADSETEGLIESAMLGQLAGVEAAIAAGVELDALGASGQTALHYASFYGHVAIIEALLAAGARVDIAADEEGPGTTTGAQPLGLLAQSPFIANHVEVARLLLAAGAALDAQDGEGMTALAHAVQDDRLALAETLLAAGADPELADGEGNTPLMLALACGHAPLADALRAAGASDRGVAEQQLLDAAESGDLATLQALIDKGVDVDHSMEGTALERACCEGQLEAARLLLAAGATVDKRRSNDDFTPLMRAAYGGHLALVELLLAAGADPQLRLDGEIDALTYARWGQQEGRDPDQPWEALIQRLTP